MSRCVTALLSTPTPMSTGSIDTWVIHEAVIPFHSSPCAEPIKARAFGIRQVTLFNVSGSTSPHHTDGEITLMSQPCEF
jgi:hypothetical protein